MAIAKSSRDAAELTRKAVEGLGGMKRFISRGDVVAIKPNIGWDRMPVHAANTNPVVVAELVKMAFDAGAARVVVTDASCNEPNRCFTRSGSGARPTRSVRPSSCPPPTASARYA